MQRMKVKVKIWVGILLLLTGVKSPGLLPLAEAQEFLAPQKAIQQILEAEKRVDFVGNRFVINFSRWHNAVLEERVTNKSPDKQRVEVLIPSEMAGFTAIRSGKQRWHISPKRGDRRRGPSPYGFGRLNAEVKFEDVELMLKNYSVKISNGIGIAGRNTYQLEITPKYEGRPSEKIWLDAENSLALRVEHYNSDSKLNSLIVYTDIAFSRKIDSSQFVRPPSDDEEQKRRLEKWEERRKKQDSWGYRSQDLNLKDLTRQAHFSVSIPEYLPAGFVFQKARLLKYREHESVHLLYTDGLVLLSLFETQNVKSKRRDGRGRETEREKQIEILGVGCKMLYDGRMRILRWEDNKLNLTLMADLSEAEMIKVTESLIATGQNSLEN